MDQTRLQQLLSHIKRTVSMVIFQIDHERLHEVVVTHVMLDNDQKKCRVLVTTPASNLQLLNGRYRHQIQKKFKALYRRRTIPELEFILDDGQTDTIDILLAQVNPQ